MSFNDMMGFTPVKTRDVDTSQYMQMGQQFLDPNSSRNRGMYNNLKQMGIDAMAQQYISGARMGAMGQNPFAQQQWRSGMANNLGQTQSAYMSGLQGNYQIGSGLMGQALQGDMNNANASNTAMMEANRNKTDFWTGVVSAGVGALGMGMFGMPGNPTGIKYGTGKWDIPYPGYVPNPRPAGFIGPLTESGGRYSWGG